MPFLRCGAEGTALLYGEAILRCTRGLQALIANPGWPTRAPEPVYLKIMSSVNKILSIKGTLSRQRIIIHIIDQIIHIIQIRFSKKSVLIVPSALRHLLRGCVISHFTFHNFTFSVTNQAPPLRMERGGLDIERPCLVDAMKLRSTRFECPESFVIHRLKVTIHSFRRLVQAWPAIG